MMAQKKVKEVSDTAARVSRFRPTWKMKLGVVLTSVLLTCLALEVFLRVGAAIERRRARAAAGAAQTPTDEYWAIYDSDLGYRQNPKFGDMNSDGLREHPIGPKQGRFRLLFLGDSIAQNGDSVDDTFVAHAREELRKNSGPGRLDVINAGIKGYTNYQELGYLKKYGLKFEPDLVGVEFCLNDLHKYLHSFRVENGRIAYGSYQFSEEALTQQREAPRSLVQRVADRSYLAGWMKKNVPIAAKAIAMTAQDGYSFDYRVDIGNAWQDEPWADIARQLAEMAELGRQRNFKVFVVVVPTAEQYEEKYLARDRDYVLKPQRKLKELCGQLGIPFYDLYSDLNAALFLDDGIHLTKEGRRLVGQRVASFLMQARLVPAGGKAD